MFDVNYNLCFSSKLINNIPRIHSYRQFLLSDACVIDFTIRDLACYGEPFAFFNLFLLLLFGWNSTSSLPISHSFDL